MFFVLVDLLSVILEPSWVQVGPSWGQVGLSIDPEGSQGRFGRGPDLQDRFLINFRSQHGAKLGPSWGHVGPRIGSIKACFFEARLELDVGASWVRLCTFFGIQNGAP